jgi:hypothetical protein
VNFSIKFGGNMADFVLPDSFDNESNNGMDAFSNSTDFTNSAPEPVYVAPTGMSALGEIAEKDALT